MPVVLNPTILDSTMGVWRLGGGPFLLTFVRATQEDLEKVRQFLAQFVDDYLAEQIQDYLGRRTGGLYLGLDEDKLVGTCVISFPKPHEAYLSGMRIAPERQGQGVAEEFAQFQLDEARRLGAQVVRVLVHADNKASAHVLQDKLGFHVVDQWAVGEINPLPSPTERPADAGPAWAVDRERLGAFLHQHADDLWAAHEWEPSGLEMRDVMRRFGQGGVAVIPQTGELKGLALSRVESKDVLHLNYLRTVGHALGNLLDYLWNEARAWGISRCRFGLSVHAAERLRALVPNTEIHWRGLVMERHLNLTTSET